MASLPAGQLLGADGDRPVGNLVRMAELEVRATVAENRLGSLQVQGDLGRVLFSCHDHVCTVVG
jgi:hypothetical protein